MEHLGNVTNELELGYKGDILGNHQWINHQPVILYPMYFPAWFRAGASFTPSPVMAATWPMRWMDFTISWEDPGDREIMGASWGFTGDEWWFMVIFVVFNVVQCGIIMGESWDNHGVMEVFFVMFRGEKRIYMGYTITGWWLSHPAEKYESQLGWWNSH